MNNAQRKASAWNAADTHPRSALIGLVGFSSLLVAAHILLGYQHSVHGSDTAERWFAYFSLGREFTVPALFSAGLWAIAGILCLSISRLLIDLSHTTRHINRYWFGLGLLSLFLALDEGLAIHEMLAEPVRNLTGAGGALTYAWVIPYGLATAVVVALYAQFVWRLSPSVRWLILLAGGVYVTGALGFELVEGAVSSGSEGGSDSTLYALLYTFEEWLEMIGVSIFIYALLRQRQHVRLSTQHRPVKG